MLFFSAGLFCIVQHCLSLALCDDYKRAHGQAMACSLILRGLWVKWPHISSLEERIKEILTFLHYYLEREQLYCLCFSLPHPASLQWKCPFINQALAEQALVCWRLILLQLMPATPYMVVYATQAHFTLAYMWCVFLEAGLILLCHPQFQSPWKIEWSENKFPIK